MKKKKKVALDKDKFKGGKMMMEEQ